MMRPLLLCLLLAGCGGPLSLLTGGGPNVAANVQAGATNSQTIGSTTIVDQTVREAQNVTQSADQTQVKAENVGHVTVQQMPLSWMIAIVVWSIFLWQLPSPNEISRWIWKTKEKKFS